VPRDFLGGQSEEFGRVVVEDVLHFRHREKVEAIDAIDGEPDCLRPHHLVATEHHPVQQPPPFRLFEEGLEQVTGNRGPAQCTDVHVYLRVHRHEHQGVIREETAAVHHIHLQFGILDKQVLEEKWITESQSKLRTTGIRRPGWSAPSVDSNWYAILLGAMSIRRLGVCAGVLISHRTLAQEPTRQRDIADD
jgi:hypothetical protein